MLRGGVVNAAWHTEAHPEHFVVGIAGRNIITPRLYALSAATILLGNEGLLGIATRCLPSKSVASRVEMRSWQATPE